jgi:hypothetical protein
MRNLDELFKNAARLNAPDALQRRVMDEIRANERARKPGWLASLTEWLRLPFTGPARAGFAFGAVVAVVAVAIVVNAPGVKAPAPTPVLAEMWQINDYIHDTVGDAYAGAGSVNSVAALESDDVNEFVTTHVESVFWIDGGSDNA